MLIYLGLVNILTFCVYGLDKLKAKRHLWRIPEYILLLLAAAGGSVGAYLAIQIFRHKTRHIKFKYGVPTIFIFQVAVFVFWR